MKKNQHQTPLEILLVEDNLADVRLLVEVLQGKDNYNMRFVEDGIEAMKYLKQKGSYASMPRPDIIILDLNLPKKDGRAVLKSIKNDANLQCIPVIVLTTSTSEEDIAEAYALHANCYICKPNDLDQFITVVNSIETLWFENAVLPSQTCS